MTVCQFGCVEDRLLVLEHKNIKADMKGQVLGREARCTMNVVLY